MTSCVGGSVVEEDWEEGESVEADGVMEIVTECWVEPQNGVVAFPSPHAQHLNHCSYRQLAQAVSTLCRVVVVRQSLLVFSWMQTFILVVMLDDLMCAETMGSFKTRSDKFMDEDDRLH